MSDQADKKETPKLTRRQILRAGLQGAAVVAIGTGAASLAVRTAKADEKYIWQLDPEKCIQCGNCATYCVLNPSAVKCVHAYAMCGYCKMCTGYFPLEPIEQNTAAENQLCPTGAINRSFVEDPYYEYTIDEAKCIGCGKCVKGCSTAGNGSLFLQIRHDRCVNCNECSIAVACPAQAFRRVPAGKPYLLKGRENKK